MYDTERIKAACGEDAATYAQNKNRGGRNNARGATFENFYAAKQATLLLAEALTQGDDGLATFIQSQQLCFVDDLIVERPLSRRLSQLKSGAVSWTAGDHPVADDFRLQKALDDHIAVPASYELVVGNAEARAGLADSRPNDVDVDVICFMYDEDIDRFFSENPDLVEALDAVSIHDPRPSGRKAAFVTLLGTWATSPERTSLADFALKAAQGPGPLIATLGPEYELPIAVGQHLTRLGMDIEIRKKHLYFRFAGMTGYSAFRGGTPEFSAFEQFVTQQKPADAYEVIARLRGV